MVSAPSGAGKSTLLGLVRKALPHLAITISATTRPPRPGEVDGKDYYFRSRKAFEDAIERHEFAEWAEVHGNLYGTYKTEINRRIKEGKSVLLEVDVQGMRNIRTLYPEMVAIFIAPPSLAELEERLILRGVNDEKDMQVRLSNAAIEMQASEEFDHVVVNDDLDRAAAELTGLIQRLAPPQNTPATEFN